MTTILWKLLWAISEFAGVGLGRFAPYVLAKMMGKPGKRL